MKAIAEIIKTRPSTQSQGIYYEWQEKALAYAEKLGLKLEGQLMKRWMKMFKQAHQGRNTLNLGRAYGYVIDHPKLLTQEAKVKMMFYIFENGLKTF